eukprot:gb/GEZN01004770.1/.p1 GENE.gb/GEZN01004770.1/~~gb/GEZN01004770.1/.p1  ORF type:complete len:500 (+),score=66.63 gb/GEZN01004770.1/:25-1500(+)
MAEPTSTPSLIRRASSSFLGRGEDASPHGSTGRHWWHRPSLTHSYSQSSLVHSPSSLETRLSQGDSWEPMGSLLHSSTLSAKQMTDLQLAREHDQEEKEKKEQERIEHWQKMTAEEKKKEADYANQVANELLETEQKYVRCLNTLKHEYVIALKALGSGLSTEQINKLVSNIETLTNFHATLLEEIKANSNELGKLFIRYADFLKLYISYMNNYGDLLEELNKLRSHKAFQCFLNNLRSKLLKLPGELDLMSYLVMPVQRVPRYLLLLKELKAHTDPSSAPYSDLTQAVVKVQETTLKLNEEKRHMEQMSFLVEMQSRISDLPDDLQLMLPSRRLLRQGPIAQMHSGIVGSAVKPFSRFLFLFNDLLLWTSSKCKYKGHLRLATVTIESDSKRLISIHNSQTAVTFKTKDDEDEMSWVHDLKAALSAAKEKIQKRRSIKKDGQNKILRNYQRESQHHSSIVGALQELAHKMENGREQTSEAGFSFHTRDSE